MTKTPKPTRAPKVFGYIRVSTEEQARHGDSLTAQQQAIARHAKTLGKPLATIYRDAGVSGSTPLEKRPQGRELLQAIRSGDIKTGDVIVAMKLDRMFAASGMPPTWPPSSRIARSR